MRQEVLKIDSSHDARIITLEGTSERDLYARTYPLDMPEGYVMRLQWLGPMQFKIWPELASSPPAPSLAMPSQEQAVEEFEDARDKLQNLDDAALEAKAGENEVSIHGKMGKKLSRAALVEKIVLKLAAKA